MRRGDLQKMITLDNALQISAKPGCFLHKKVFTEQSSLDMKVCIKFSQLLEKNG
jgi:hypothetical protein